MQLSRLIGGTKTLTWEQTWSVLEQKEGHCGRNIVNKEAVSIHSEEGRDQIWWSLVGYIRTIAFYS